MLRPASPIVSAAPALLMALTLVGASACNRPPDDPKDYVARIGAARAGKDAEFQRSDDPIPADRKAELLPLAYFPIDPEYNVAAALTPAAGRIEQMLPTSTGTRRKMLQVGTLDFTLKGQPMSLLAFTESDLNMLSVMFSDITSGTETYPAGRYIDLIRTATGVYELDFNKAFNPYCYYNVSYECPYPPPENRLKVPVRAGERMREQEGTS